MPQKEAEATGCAYGTVGKPMPLFESEACYVSCFC